MTLPMDDLSLPTIEELAQRVSALEGAEPAAEQAPSMLALFNGYIWVAVVAFLVSVIATPIMRQLALSQGIIDRPSDPRKVHRRPIAYLGGAAVFLGLMFGILFSYFAYRFDWLIEFHATEHGTPETLGNPLPVPLSILAGMAVITIVGLLDDVFHLPPWPKIGGQLFAAAALAYEDVGVKVAAGLLQPIANVLGFEDLIFTVPLGGMSFQIDLIYWTGTLIIAGFVIGACNASNLIDGLDGLLTGTTAIAAMGLLFIAMLLALADDGPLDGMRLVLCLALLGACLGFLPHNFNPASIFLGDSGSMLMGYTTIVIVLTLGDTGRTNLVIAGLVIYGVPLTDTVLAIVRRKLAGKSVSVADDQHLHHMLKRALGVKGAVFVLYAIGLGFAVLGVLLSVSRARVGYAASLLFASYIGIIAIKAARQAQLEREADEKATRHELPVTSPRTPAAPEPSEAVETKTTEESAEPA
ncbi:MAG: MraY family glycosyltransferase [Planctomycetota bacterium]